MRKYAKKNKENNYIHIILEISQNKSNQSNTKAYTTKALRHCKRQLKNILEELSYAQIVFGTIL